MDSRWMEGAGLGDWEEAHILTVRAVAPSASFAQ